MSKNEFLDELRMALTSRVSAKEVTEHIQYYEDYINTQVRMGKTETQVVEELGEPRLLARNIAESKKYANVENDRSYGGYGGNVYENNPASERKPHKTSGWMIALVVFLCLFVVFGIIFSVLSLLAPVLIPVVLVILCIRLVKKNT